MLELEVAISENYNEERNEFITETFRIELEHSLLSLSKWESKFNKAFLTNSDKTPEELLWYVEAMTITPNVPPEVFLKLTEKNIDEISTYINSKQSATHFPEMPAKPGRRETVTSELIYTWMFSLSIPKECESWHLARLFNTIRIQSAKNTKPQKMGRREMLEQRRRLNEERRAKLGTTG